ncbi:MAG: OmpA family protein, partial [Gammaproteobacteria bacterium]|nr:OmpA family protein [Gammaproteobacteria bacterium]
QSGNTPVKLPHRLALRLLLELENGMQPVFLYRTAGNVSDTVTVRLSNVQFADAMQQFRFCVSRLDGNDAIAISRVEVRFAHDSASLDQRAHPHLDRVAAKIAGDPGVRRVILTGHADQSGASSYNLELSERRARSVLDYLADRGVEASLLEVVAMGESSATNSHLVAAAQRHVAVEILR